MLLENPAATRQAGVEIAAKLAAGDVVALTGILGAGKTELSHGIAIGLGVTEPVTSPTFTLVHEYHSGRLPVFHFDLYRLESPAALLETGWDDILEAGGIVIVEWADRFPELLPSHTRWIELAHAPAGRVLKFAAGWC